MEIESFAKLFPARWIIEHFDIVKGAADPAKERIDIWLDEKKQTPTNYYAEQYVLFKENLDERISMDETCLSQGELYTIVTNKAAKGKRAFPNATIVSDRFHVHGVPAEGMIC